MRLRTRYEAQARRLADEAIEFIPVPPAVASG